MILGHNPDAPDKAKGRYLGYWASCEDLEACHYARRGEVLPWPGDFVDASWDIEERTMVADYLEEGRNVTFWMGASYCRLGCDQFLGTADRGDGEYTWPEGFSHYIREHGVKPPQEFIDHIRLSFRYD